MATPQTQTSTPAPAPRKIMGHAGKFKRRDFAATDYLWVIEKGHTLEDLKNPEYWGHIAGKLRTNDHIWCAAEDNSFYCLARVVANASTWAKVQILLLTEDAGIEVDPTPERELYKIDHIATGWRVIHRNTGKTLASGLPRRDDAEAAITTLLAEKTKQ